MGYVHDLDCGHIFTGTANAKPYPSLFCLFFCLLYFLLPPFEELGCFSGCLMSSAGIQKLFCVIYSTFKCSFDEFVGEKVFSSYSSTILAPPPQLIVFKTHCVIQYLLYFKEILCLSTEMMKTYLCVLVFLKHTI